jgi:hypothetical protein
MNNTDAPRCSFRNCPQTAVHSETGDLPHWTVTVYYCHEHARELGLGTPVGPVGLDSERVEIHYRGREDVKNADTFHAISPQ